MTSAYVATPLGAGADQTNVLTNLVRISTGVAPEGWKICHQKVLASWKQGEKLVNNTMQSLHTRANPTLIWKKDVIQIYDSSALATELQKKKKKNSAYSREIRCIQKNRCDVLQIFFVVSKIILLTCRNVSTVFIAGDSAWGPHIRHPSALHDDVIKWKHFPCY